MITRNIQALCRMGLLVVTGLVVVQGCAQAYVESRQLSVDVTMKNYVQAPQERVPQSDVPVAPIERRDGIICINGLNAFNQAVVQASHARPVLVLFYAQRNTQSQDVWARLASLAQQADQKVDVVSAEIFAEIADANGQQDNQNYQIMTQCMHSLGMDSVPLPLVVFFKNGLMCSSANAVFTGDDVQLKEINAVVAQLETK